MQAGPGPGPGAGAGPGTGPGAGLGPAVGVSTAPAWVTLDLWSSRMIVPVRRSLAGLGLMPKRTVWAPLPVVRVSNEIQLTSVEMVHEQPLIVETVTSRFSPLASTVRVAGRSSNRQGAACCDTRTRLSFTTISPSRTEGRGLGATRNSTVLEPCPDAGERPDSQFAAVETSHGHSGVVVTVIAPVPPSGPILGEEAASATWHFNGVGAAVTSDLDSQALTAIAAPRRAPRSNKRW